MQYVEVMNMELHDMIADELFHKKSVSATVSARRKVSMRSLLS